MSELEKEILSAQRRLLIMWLDWFKTGEDCTELVEETKFIIEQY